MNAESAGEPRPQMARESGHALQSFSAPDVHVSRVITWIGNQSYYKLIVHLEVKVKGSEMKFGQESDVSGRLHPPDGQQKVNVRWRVEASR